MDDEIKGLLRNILLKMDTIEIQWREVKQLLDNEPPVDSPPVPAVPIERPFGLPSFEEMQKSEAATSVTNDEQETGGLQSQP